jgi:Domain of Unknown Function (DUF1259)
MIIKNTERNSEAKNRSMSSRTFAALIVSISMLSAAIMLSTMTNDSFAQGSNTNTTASSSSGGGQGTAAAGLSLNCQSIASTIGGIVIPNPSKICDVLIPRQSPTIMGPGNMNMNKFSTINSIVEVAPVSDLMVKSNASSSGTSGSGGGSNRGQIGGAASSATSNTSSQRVFAMGEFSLLDPQLVTMVKATVGSNWTIAAIHNHMVLEKPKMMFVHWSAEGELNTITNQIKNVLLILSKVPSSGS